MLFPESILLRPLFHWISTNPAQVVLLELTVGAILARTQLPLKQLRAEMSAVGDTVSG